jgi:hypothetical protein
MIPEGRMRAAEAPKSCADSWHTKQMAPPPGTGRPSPGNNSAVVLLILWNAQKDESGR